MNDHDATTPIDAAAAGLGATIIQKALEPIVRAVRRELTAARDEIGDRIAGARTGILLTAAGALGALVSLGLVAALAVVLLHLVLPLWAAAGVTLVIFVVASAILLAVGIRAVRRGVPPIPRDTLAGRNRDR